MQRTTTLAKWIFGVLAIAAFATVGLLRAQQSAEQPKLKAVRDRPTNRESNPPRAGATPTPLAPALAQVPVASPPPNALKFKQGFFRHEENYVPGSVVTFGPTAPEDPGLAALKQADAAMAQETANRIARYAETEDEVERFTLKGGLSDLLAKHFDVQQQLRERELAQVEARIKKLRDLAQKRREAQQTIVQQRLEQLLREAEGLGWTPPENSLSAESVTTTAPFARSGVGLPAPAYSAGVGAGAIIAVPTSND